MHSVEAVFVCDFDAQLNPKIAYPQKLLSCEIFYPPQSPRPVDNLSYFCCATRSRMRLSNCQAAMPPRKSGPSGKPWNGSKATGYRIGMDRKRKLKKQEEKVAAGKQTPSAG
jgi:hypothetical protein